MSFKIASGEIVALAGESGSGKSSIAYAVGRLLSPDVQIQGEICFSGENILAATPAQMNGIRRSRLAFIFQDPSTSLNPLMTIGSQLRMAGIESGLHSECLNMVNLKDTGRILSSYPHELSGGMKQRLMIAAAVAKKPELIIADEPTASLDATVGDGVMKELRALSLKNRCAMLLITHDLKLAQKFADRILFMRAGELVGDSDTHSESGSQYIRQLKKASVLNQQPKTRIETADA
ncbi:MAG: ABC transporter ATP-binding protein [Candidatus Omnitrophica bacterium]|nr:ABC transporter ATP-binding protein [Candidatus Omnitrophota bacterium]